MPWSVAVWINLIEKTLSYKKALYHFISTLQEDGPNLRDWNNHKAKIGLTPCEGIICSAAFGPDSDNTDSDLLSFNLGPQDGWEREYIHHTKEETEDWYWEYLTFI